MKIPDDEVWLPQSLRFSFGEPVVKVAKLKEPLLGFVSDLDFSSKENSFNVPLMDIDLSDKESQIDGFIFHFPRSGSTAVARGLGSLNNAACFFEPNCINELLTHELINNEFQSQWLRQLIGLYSSNYKSLKASVFIKLSSWALLYITLFEDVFADVPLILVYRNPADVLVQIHERPTGWMGSDVQKVIQPRLMNKAELVDGLSKQLTELEYCSLMLQAFCRQALAVKQPLHLVSHSTFSDDLLKVLSAIDCDLSEGQRLDLLESLSHDSELWGTTQAYVHDSDTIRSRASQQMLVEEQQIMLLLEKLEKRFQ